jgi:DNA-binding CsgD family transcriptional regulator
VTPTPSESPDLFDERDRELLAFVVAAQTQEEAADWLKCSSTHLRRRLKQMREQLGVDTNQQLVALASASGAIDLDKVLPVGNALADLDPVNPGRGGFSAGQLHRA